MKIILGSSSKYRKAVLEGAGYVFETMKPDFDEESVRTEDYRQLPMLLAREKAKSLISKITEPALLISSDIVIICDEQLYEKPVDAAQSRAWLKKYSEGYPAECVCAVIVTNTATGKQAEGIDIAKVYFNPMPDAVIEEFIEKGDPYSKAGGFAIQSELLKPYMPKIEGEVSSVMGLPIALLEKLMAEVK